MASEAPLVGTELIDCARANSNQGIEAAAQRCGYGDDLATFERELQKAGEYIGVEIKSFQDLSDTQENLKEPRIVIAPDSPTQL
jgi:hypothetical protein